MIGLSGVNSWSWRTSIRRHFTAGITTSLVLGLQWVLVAGYYSSLPHDLIVKARRFLLLNLLVALLMVVLARSLRELPLRLLTCWSSSRDRHHWTSDPLREAQWRRFLFRSLLWLTCFVQVFLFCNMWFVLDAWTTHSDHSHTSPVRLSLSLSPRFKY